MTAIWIASLLALVLGGACFRVLRKLTQPQVSAEDLNTWIEINWQADSPLERLLDPSEFEFLRKRGMGRQRLEQLQAKRRSLFRMYVRRLTQEFNAAQAALRAVVVAAEVDRPDLVAVLGKQRLLFYRALIRVEVLLTLNALGLHAVGMPSLALLRPLERLHLEFCRLVPAPSAVQA